MTVAPLRVLVIDDNPGDVRLVEIALDRSPLGPFRVERADRVAGALDRLLADPPVDVVLLDVQLPDSAGLDGLARIRARQPDVAVVLHSSSADPRRILELRAAGAQAYLVKGLETAALLPGVLHAAAARERLLVVARRNPSEAVRRLPQLDGFGEGSAIVDGASWSAMSPRFRVLAGAGSGPRPPPGFVATTVAEWGRQRPAFAERRGDGPAGTGLLEIEWRRIGPESTRPALLSLREVAPRTPELPAGPLALQPAPALDAAAWAELLVLAGGRREFLVEILDAYAQEASARERELVEAAARSDLTALRRAAHTFRSSAGQVAALALAARCGELESAAASGDREQALRLVATIPPMAARVAKALAARRPVL